MTTFKINKNKDFTIMSNYHLRDKNLSLKAKGLLSYMLSLPEDWDYSLKGLVSICKENKDAIRSTLNELKHNSYLKIEPHRRTNGKFEYNYIIYEKPFNMILKIKNLPNTDFPDTDKPITENPPQINTNKQIDKIDKTKFNHEILLNELIRVGYIKENDEQLVLYDSLFDKLVNDGNNYVDIYSAIHYIAPRVLSRCFVDEEGNNISNKFGYFKTAIISNIKKLASYDEELYPSDDINDYKLKQSSKEREER